MPDTGEADNESGNRIPNCESAVTKTNFWASVVAIQAAIGSASRIASPVRTVEFGLALCCALTAMGFGGDLILLTTSLGIGAFLSVLGVFAATQTSMPTKAFWSVCALLSLAAEGGLLRWHALSTASSPSASLDGTIYVDCQRAVLPTTIPTTGQLWMLPLWLNNPKDSDRPVDGLISGQEGPGETLDGKMFEYGVRRGVRCVFQNFGPKPVLEFKGEVKVAYYQALDFNGLFWRNGKYYFTQRYLLPSGLLGVGDKNEFSFYALDVGTTNIIVTMPRRIQIRQLGEHDFQSVNMSGGGEVFILDAIAPSAKPRNKLHLH